MSPVSRLTLSKRLVMLGSTSFIRSWWEVLELWELQELWELREVLHLKCTHGRSGGAAEATGAMGAAGAMGVTGGTARHVAFKRGGPQNFFEFFFIKIFLSFTLKLSSSHSFGQKYKIFPTNRPSNFFPV